MSRFEALGRRVLAALESRFMPRGLRMVQAECLTPELKPLDIQKVFY